MTPPMQMADEMEVREVTTDMATEAEPTMYAMPATQGQVRFWSLDRLNPGDPALNMPLMWQCKGVMDVARLRRAFSLCVQRHEMLRTTFELVDGQLTQIIGPAFEVRMPLVDLSMIPDPAHSAEARKLIREHAALKMDLKHGPLLELKLLKYSDQHHLLLVTMHHIICDGISLGILLRDAAVFYEALAQGVEARLPELPIQFGDYAVWAEQWRESAEAEASRRFWRESLGKDFQRLNVHHDQIPAGSLPEDTGDIETLLISPELTAAAHRFCVRESVTLNLLLTSIFTALMSRLTGQLDLVIGSPCGNRTEETEELIGLFMNIQVMRIQMEETTTFRELLAKVQTWSLGAYENQALPFEDLIHDRYYGNGNAFEIPVFFLYQKSFMLTQQVAGLEITPLRSESPGAIFDLMFAIVDRPEEGPRLQLEYNPQSYKVETIRRILRMFVGLLESALMAPEKRVDELRVLSVAEREEILREWNHTNADFGTFEPVAAVFARRALALPDEIAVECAGHTWTNGQLHRFASQVAARLHHDGLKPNGLVGICVERSFEMVGAVLGVLMAGGSYLPMDPRYPMDRLQMMADDSGIEFLLTHRSHPVPLTTQAQVLDLKALGTSTRGAERFQHARDVLASDLAYVIYTSGSTGRPKGVAIEHGSLMNLLQAMEREIGFTAKDKLLAITTLAFDIAGLEVLLPLLTGARLVLATDEQAQDGGHLVRLMQASRATVMQGTPGVWRMAIDAGWTGEMPLKVLCGGEAMPRDLAEKLLDRSNEVWNVYGPTETTIWSSATRVTRGSGPLPLGPAIANTQFYILDHHLQPTAIGVAGELYIAGAGVARGYWKRPELTAERFVANPFGPGRMYQTGDLARWTPDGLFELLGRSDLQIKVRGYRVEPGEIEAILNEHGAVAESVVIAHTGKPRGSAAGITRLVAFVAVGEAAGGSEALLAELGKRMQQRLPDYLCPSAIIPLPALPRTPNGKIDRKALPALLVDLGLDGEDEEAAEYTPPRDAIERQLVMIWQTTLGIPRISVRSSFFSLGVGSLAALRLIKQMNRTYALDLGLASLISASTIESVAELVRTRFAPNTASSLVPIHAQGALPPLFIVHGVGGNIVNFYGLSQRMGREQPVYGIQAQSLESGRPALLRLEDMAAHYNREIRSVQPKGPYYLLGYSFGGTVTLEMARQLQAAGEEIALLGMLDSKSRLYEEGLAKATPVQAVVEHRMNRFQGNIEHLSLRERITYIQGKLVTRSIRYAVKLAAKLGLRSVPSFMKSAEDINRVAVNNYELKPFDGRLTLFRAEEQDHADATEDFGWGEIFTQGYEVRRMPGDHERLFLEPGIDVLAEQLRQALRAAQNMYEKNSVLTGSGD